MRFTLRQIEIFLAAAREQNISRAAKALHMSQSAASTAIQSLEELYNLQLFERSGNRLALSPAGQALRGEAEILLAHSQNFENQLLAHEKTGHLKVAASFTIGNHLASRYLAQYMIEHPQARVDLDIANTPEVVNKVLEYEVDIGMIEGESSHRGLELIPWRDDELVVFCAASHPLAKKSSLTSKDIASAKWILREADSGARQTFERAMGRDLEKVNVFLEFRHNEAIKNAVETGLGIGCLSRMVLEKNFHRGDLVPLTLPKRNMKRTFFFALARKRVDNYGVVAWMNICRENG